MFRCIRSIFTLGVISAALTSASVQAGAFFNFTTENYSNAFRVLDLYQDDPETLKKGDVIYTHSRADIGGSFLDWFSISAMLRYDGVIDHSPDAAYIYYANSRKLDFEDRTYDYRIDTNVVSTFGGSFAVFHEWDAFDFEVRVDLGETRNLNLGNLHGSLTFEDGNISGTANLDYQYQRDLVFKRDAESPKGFAYGMSLALGYRSPVSEHKLRIEDAFYIIDWNNAPFTEARLNTDRIGGTNAQGQIVVRPLGSGREGYEDLQQSLPTRWYLNNAFDIYGYWVLVDLDYIVDRVWPKIGYQWRLENQQISLRYSTRDQAISFQHKFKDYVSYGLALDNIDVTKAHRIDLQLFLHWH